MAFILHDNVRINTVFISSYYPWGPYKTSGTTESSIILLFHGDTAKRYLYFNSEEQRDEFLSRLDALNKVNE